MLTLSDEFDIGSALAAALDAYVASAKAAGVVPFDPATMPHFPPPALQPHVIKDALPAIEFTGLPHFIAAIEGNP